MALSATSFINFKLDDVILSQVQCVVSGVVVLKY